MKSKSAREIIIKPLVTEKSMTMHAIKKYTFVVDPRSNKTEIKNAIQEIFDVKVNSVNKVKVLPKAKKLGKFAGFKSSYTKAIVSLSKDSKEIQLFENN